MQYGSEITTYPLDNKGTAISDYKHFRLGGVDRTLRTYRITLKVKNAQEEMTEYIRFTTELAELRRNKKLASDKDRTESHPAFIIQFPKEDVDGSYYITKCYTVFLDN